MIIDNIDWEENILLVNNDLKVNTSIDSDERRNVRREIEPWLSAIFQSEHLSLLAGNGLTLGTVGKAGIEGQGMDRIVFEDYSTDISSHAEKYATKLGRGTPNFEDDLRAALELAKGLEITDPSKAEKLDGQISSALEEFMKSILATERKFETKINEGDEKANAALNILKSFLISFSSRSASRERLNLFTTNYDRFIEYALDGAGILKLDRFVGSLRPEFRETKLNYDFHYNPPGIKGEPRYVEGVVRYSKLHGSIDWTFKNKKVQRSLLPFGAEDNHTELQKDSFQSQVIYPNSSKGVETTFYPYSELFREFSTSICRPNSSLVTYGYGFGDSHINSIIEDMLTIPSTHLVIISYDDSRGLIKNFFKDKNPSQFTLLIGEEFGKLDNLVKHYLPKSAIDRITLKKTKLLENRGEKAAEPKKSVEVNQVAKEKSISDESQDEKN